MADKYLVTNTQLENIANAIRNKSKETEKMGIEDMPEKIANLTNEMLIKPDSYPDYVRKEALRVANLARTKIKEDSIVSICMSDSHYPDSSVTKSGFQHALMAIKSLAYLLPVDFIAHMGDVGYEDHNGQNIIDVLRENLKEILPMIKETSQDTIPLFVAIGNHDVGGYVTSGDATDTLEAQEPGFMFKNFTALTGENAVYGDDTTGGGYCYYDIEAKRTRIFLLNSCETSVKTGNANSTTVGITQQEWIATSLLNLNTTKTNPEQWNFIVLCHFPLDYGEMKKDVSDIFKAYVEGKTITINNNSYDFNNNNKAIFVAQFHGHVHNFLQSQLYDSSKTQYNAWRLCTPNAQYNRENYYTIVEDINYQQSETYSKTPGTAQDVSFVINVINPSEEKIYSFTYGAGPEIREIGYNFTKIKYNITANLTNIELIDGLPSFIYEGSSFTTTLKAVAGYSLDYATVMVTMGGIDITSSAYNDGIIAIEKITGDIEITASTIVAEYYTITRTLENATSSSNTEVIYPPFTAGYAETITIGPGWHFDLRDGEFIVNMGGTDVTSSYVTKEVDDNYNKYYSINIPEVTGPIEIIAKARGEENFTNLVPLSINTDGTDYYDSGDGYTQGFYINSSGNAFSQASNAVSTGYIDISKFIGQNKQIRIGGTGISIPASSDLYYTTKFIYYDEDFNMVQNNAGYNLNYNYANIINGSGYPSATLNENKNTALTLDITSSNFENQAYYVRFSIDGDGANLIVTVNEEITYGGIEHNSSVYTITQTLTNVETSNSATTVTKGESFITTLTPTSDEYELSSVTVAMGGIDVTSLYYSKGIININEVTGNIIITAIAIKIGVEEIINLLPLATEADGTTIYGDGKGYKEGYRISTSSGLEVETTSGCCLTGYIKCDSSPKIIRIKNVTLKCGYDTTSLITYNALGSTYSVESIHLCAGGDPLVTADENGVYTFEFTDANSKYMRLSCGITDETIITINQEIP